MASLPNEVNLPTEVNLPADVPRAAGNLNDGQVYERKLLLFIAASLSQNTEVKDFAIVSNPKGIDKIDDVVVRIVFEKTSGKEDIALFVQSKLAESEDKLLWLNFGAKPKRRETNKVEINLTDYERAFENVTKITSSNGSTNEELRELLKGVDKEHYYVCIFTNMRKSDSEFKLLPRKFNKDDPIFNCLDTGVECDGGRYHQFDGNNTKLDRSFYRQLFILLGQPNFTEIDFGITNKLGKDFEKVLVNLLVNLDDTLKEFMQKGNKCSVLTKAKFEVHCLKVMLDKWLRVDLELVEQVEINPKFLPVWCRILSHQTVINLGDYKIWPLVANYYQWVIREVQQNENVAELLLSLWRDNKIPLPIKSDYTQNILGFLTKFKTINNSFIIFCSNSTESVMTYVKDISDKETLSEIFNTEVSLEGRPPVSLAKIAGVPIETAIRGIFKDLTISQVLVWTENRKTHIIGPQLRPPDVNYITRNFTRKGEKQTKLTQQAVLELIGPRLHIIKGEPGLGKSTVLEVLARSYTPQNFIIYVKLRDCLDDIENPSLWYSIQDDPIKYFFNKMTNRTDDKITISIMETHTTGKRLSLFLDGFDEILPSHGKQVSLLMEMILTNTDIPITCTTRPHAKNKITTTARAIVLELLPFDTVQVIEYFAKANIETKDILFRFGFEFLGNPLHLDMLSQIYVDKENRDGFTRGEMYKRFIQLKHEIYNKKRGSRQNDAHVPNRTSMRNHRVLAMVDIFGKECVTSKGLTSHTELKNIVTDIGEQNIGIVERNANGFQFGHRTFAEYFVADFLLHTIVEDECNTQYFKHFHKVVWSDRAYINIRIMMRQLTRNFDLWLEAIQYFFINSDNENKSSKCSCDGYFGWIKCDMYHPNVNGSMIVSTINRDYLRRTRLTEDDGDTCVKLLTAIKDENVDDVESYLTQSLLDTGCGIVGFNLAITTGNRSIVKIFLDLRPTLVDEQDVNGNTGLHISCAFGYRSIAALLFEQSPNLRIVNKNGTTAIGMATEHDQWGIWMVKHIGKISKRSDEHGHASSTKHQSSDLSKASFIASNNLKWDIVKQLLESADPTQRRSDSPVIDNLSEAVLDVNKKTQGGKTPLSIACEEGESDIVKRLLEHGADPTLSDEDGWLPMHFASQSGELQIIDMLAGRGLDVNKKTNDGQTPLVIACDRQQWDIVKWLLKHGADPTPPNKLLDDVRRPRYTYISAGRRWRIENESVKLPATNSLQSNGNGCTLMHFAARVGQIEIIEMLLDRGLNVNERTNDGGTPLTIACANRKSDTVKWLLEHDADPTLSDKAGWTVTHVAAQRDDIQILEILTEKGVNINTKSNDGDTPLTIACAHRKSDTVKWLLEHDADPTLSDKAGWTVTHFAAQRDDILILEILTEKGVNINAKTNDGDTPLTIACANGESDTVKWLLEHDADPTLSDKAGWTVTHFAAQRDDILILEILTEKGVNINAKTNDGDTPLTIACANGESDTVKWLLEHDADPTLSDKDGWTVTHFAAQRDNIQILEYLTEKGVNINAKTNDGDTPLTIACANGESDTVKWLLEHDADPTLSDKAGWTVAHFAAEAGDIQILEILTEKGVNINAKTNDGVTPLTIACANRKSDTVKWLLEHDADPTLSDKAGWTVAHFAAEAGDIQILEILTEKGVNINAKTNDGVTPLTIACANRKSDTVKWLLEHDADPTLSDKAGWTVAHFAAEAGDIQILEMLTEKGVNINAKTNDGSTPLTIACANGKSDTVKWLLEHDADPTPSYKAGWTVAHFAAKRGDIQILEMLTEKGVNINAKTNDGDTPLTIACANGESDTVKWLLEHDADPTLSDKAGWTVTHFAAKRGDIQILEMLTEKGVNINAKTNDGSTPLTIACANGKSDTVKWLLEHDADPTPSYKAGWTVAHFAAEAGDIQILEMLTEKGVNINAKTNDGSTPLSIAGRMVAFNILEFDIVDWLLEHGADPCADPTIH